MSFKYVLDENGHVMVDAEGHALLVNISGNIVQSTGTSTVDIMSQKAVTDVLSEAGKVSDVKLNNTSVVSDRIANIIIEPNAVPAGSISTYKSASVWSRYADYIIEAQ